ncbi:MAG: response regulator transcription factor [Clostridium sp.]|uniref:response regulator transcription factor n=1 Tax=Clostridium sp. TaxID=1506 RepID=UPI002FCC06AC
MKKLVIIEDDLVLGQELQSFLSKYDFDAVLPSSFENIVEYTLNQEPDLVLLDVNLPIYDGYYICREIRRVSDVPIIIITSRNSDMDELMSMNLGADDFVTKPFNTQILLARITAILKRVEGRGNSSSTLTYKDLTLNLSNATVSCRGLEVELTKNEVRILSILIEGAGSIVSREALMEGLWKDDYFVDDSTLSVNVVRLRRKLDSIGLSDIIETRRGLGYIMP